MAYSKKSSTSKKSEEPKKSVAEIIVNRLIDKIENETFLPWQRSFNYDCMNWSSGYKYKGINKYLLYGGSGEYITFNQLKDFNEKNKSDFKVVEKGKSEIVLYASNTKKKITAEKAKEMIEKGYGKFVIKDEEGNYYYTKFTWLYHTVFDIQHIRNSKGDSLPSKLEQNKDETEYPEVEKVIEEYILRTAIRLKEGNTSYPYYTHIGDYVSLPDKSRSVNNLRYYATYLHELIHSTGVKKRLNRKCFEAYHDNKKERGREEFVAEVGSNLLLSHCGLAPADNPGFENSMNYVSGWCNWMKSNPDEVIRGMFEVDKSVEYFLTGKVLSEEKSEPKNEVKPAKEDNSETRKISLEKKLNLLLNNSLTDENKRSFKIKERIKNSSYHERFLNDENFKEVKSYKGIPIYVFENGSFVYYCSPTFILRYNTRNRDMYHILYSYFDGDSLIEAFEKNKAEIKSKVVHDFLSCLNLRKKIA